LISLDRRTAQIRSTNLGIAGASDDDFISIINPVLDSTVASKNKIFYTE
jgi:hypothetical protein